MTTQLAPTPVFKEFDNNGNPLANGQLFSYAAGTSTPQATWVDFTQATQNTNPVILNARGECNLWLDPTLSYKLILKDSLGNQIWSVDNINGALNPNSSIIPAINNNYTLGSPAFSWANVYVGPNGAPVLDTASGNIGYYKQTSAEIAANVTPVDFVYPPYDIRRYGGDPTGVAGTDTPLANAIAVCGAVGGTIRFPAGVYTFANSVNLQDKRCITLQGDGTASGGSTVVTQLSYTGTASPWFNCNSAYVQFKGMQLVHTNAGFTGTYLTFNHSASAVDATFCGVFDCLMGAAISNTTHIDLDKAVSFSAERCNFLNGNPSVSGQNSGGASYANAIRFRDCGWENCASAPLLNGGSAWTIEGCFFEGLANGAPGALASNASTARWDGLIVQGNWFGDVSSTVGAWISIYGGEALIAGNYISGANPGSSGILLNNFSGATITGNVFTALAVGINFSAATCKNIICEGNTFTSVGAPYATPANVTVGTFIWGPNFGVSAPPTGHGTLSTNGYEVNSQTGIIRQWGTLSVTSGTPVSVTFATNGIAFPNSVYSVLIAMGTAGTVGNVAYLSGSITTTGFTANVSGSGSNSVYWQAIGS